MLTEFNRRLQNSSGRIKLFRERRLTLYRYWISPQRAECYVSFGAIETLREVGGQNASVARWVVQQNQEICRILGVGTPAGGRECVGRRASPPVAQLG